MYETYIGCQPIYSKELNLSAYQLLFRSNNIDNEAHFPDADLATSQVILNTLTEFGLDKLIGTRKAYINFTRNYLLGKYPIPNITKRIIVELADDMEYDSAIHTALQSLVLKGYTIAMSDKVYLEYFKDKYPIPCVVKVDVQTHNKEHLEEHLAGLRGDDVKLLAERIETQDEFSHYSLLDFDYFRGFFFCQPNIIKGKSIPANKLQLIKVLSKLQDPDADVNMLEELVSSNISLSYRLLRYANSSHLGLNTRIDSINNAISLLGWDTVRMVTTLLTLASVEDKPPELFYFALIRAKMCELICEAGSDLDKHAAFTVGLLSIIDALFDTAMEELLAKLPLSTSLTEALMEHKGILGYILHDVIHYIHNQPEQATRLGLGISQLKTYYLKALIWANATSPLLRG